MSCLRMLIHSFVKRTAGGVALVKIRFASWRSGLFALSVCKMGSAVQRFKSNSHESAIKHISAHNHGTLLHCWA